VELDGGVYAGGTKIRRNDIVASNGIYHAIDRLISPPASRDVDAAQGEAATLNGADPSADNPTVFEA
jgi:hypothetical protein